MKLEFKVEHIANTVMVVDSDGQVWKSWFEEDFTERKLNNYMKKILSAYPV